MGKKILVIDDEQRVVDLLSKFLSKEGFEVLSAIDGNTGVRLAKKFIPDLIILDVIMPGMDGGEVMEQIQEDDKLAHIPVIFLTGAVTEEESAVRNEKSSGLLYMSKAGDITEQIKFIKKVLSV